MAEHVGATKAPGWTERGQREVAEQEWADAERRAEEVQEQIEDLEMQLKAAEEDRRLVASKPHEETLALMRAALNVRDGRWINGAPSHVMAELATALNEQGFRIAREVRDDG